MITKVNPYGHISLTNDYFSGLVEQAARQCYGIAAMGQAPAESVVRNALRTGSLPPKGVTVTQEEGRLVIALHIKVGYGLNPKHYPPRKGRSGTCHRPESGTH